jgi:transcriptional regulator
MGGSILARPFDEVSNADVVELIRENPLAWVVSHDSTGFAATPLPLMAEKDVTGAVVRLLGHMARSNPQVAILERSPRAFILFQGPQGYISPSWISDRTWAPTWNYAVIRIEADITFLPNDADRALDQLVAKMEADRPNAWSIEEMGERYDRLKPAIIAFHAEVRSLRARFKLGQDERPAVLAEILAGSDDPELERWMRRMNPGRA